VENGITVFDDSSTDIKHTLNDYTTPTKGETSCVHGVPPEECPNRLFFTLFHSAARFDSITLYIKSSANNFVPVKDFKAPVLSFFLEQKKAETQLSTALIAPQLRRVAFRELSFETELDSFATSVVIN
jgi:hypothetical protein